MNEFLIGLEWNLQEKELKPNIFSKTRKIEINDNFFIAGAVPKYGGNENEINPEIFFNYNFLVSKEEMDKMQDRSHRFCFVKNSLS